jgi:hypothetical protein
MSKTKVIDIEKRKEILTKIALGKTFKFWAQTKEGNVQIKLTATLSERIKAIKLLHDIDSGTNSEGALVQLPLFYDENEMKVND